MPAPQTPWDERIANLAAKLAKLRRERRAWLESERAKAKYRADPRIQKYRNAGLKGAELKAALAEVRRA